MRIIERHERGENGAFKYLRFAMIAERSEAAELRLVVLIMASCTLCPIIF